MSELESLQNVIHQYREAWNRLDVDALTSFWDAQEPAIYYLAEEMDEPFYQLDQVVSYWGMTRDIIDRLNISVEDVRSRLLSDDLGVLTYRMHVDATMKGFNQQGFKPIGSDVKVSAILRQREGDWRMIHYMEAHLGALPFIRRVYNANVRPDFES